MSDQPQPIAPRYRSSPPQPSTQRESYAVGLGWRISEEDGKPCYHHGGAIAGGRAFVLAYPADRTAVVLLANMYAGFGRDEARDFAKIFRHE